MNKNNYRASNFILNEPKASGRNIILWVGSLRSHIRDKGYSNIIRGIVIQNALSTLTSNMKKLTFIVPLLTVLLSQFIPELVQGFAVATGGKGFKQEFYCEAPDCAANVTVVFCKDERVFSGDRIEDCAGQRPAISVCQHQGRAFVSTDSGGNCEFEGNDGFIETKKCTDLDSTCVFTTGTSPPKHLGPAYVVNIVCGVLGFMIVL